MSLPAKTPKTRLLTPYCSRDGMVDDLGP
jgi:hypothetical protein